MATFLNAILEKQITVHARQIASKLLDPKRPRLATIGSAARSDGRSENLWYNQLYKIFRQNQLCFLFGQNREQGGKGVPLPPSFTGHVAKRSEKTSRPTFLRHLTYMDIKVAASGLSDHPTWSLNLFEFVFAIQLESFLCTFNSCITPAVIIKVATAISLPASTDSNQFWSRNKVR